MRRTITVVVALLSIWGWYASIRQLFALAEPQLSSQRSLARSLGAELPLPTVLSIKLYNAHVPIILAAMLSAVLLLVERSATRPETRQVWHAFSYLLLLLYLTYTSLAIVMSGGTLIGSLK